MITCLRLCLFLVLILLSIDIVTGPFFNNKSWFSSSANEKTNLFYAQECYETLTARTKKKKIACATKRYSRWKNLTGIIEREITSGVRAKVTECLVSISESGFYRVITGGKYEDSSKADHPELSRNRSCGIKTAIRIRKTFSGTLVAKC